MAQAVASQAYSTRRDTPWKAYMQATTGTQQLAEVDKLQQGPARRRAGIVEGTHATRWATRHHNLSV